MTEKEQNKLAMQIIAMPPGEWAELKKKISAVMNIAARVRSGERSWKNLMNGSVNRAWTTEILFAAGFRFFEDGRAIQKLKEFGNKKRTVFPAEDE